MTEHLLPQAKAERFLMQFLREEDAYHDHKKRMAYAGILLEITGFTWAITGKNWPPTWLEDSPGIAFFLITLVWYFILRFIKWQLLRRRKAAVIVEGIMRLLSLWISKPPCDWQIEPSGRKTSDKDSKLHTIRWTVLDHLDFNPCREIEKPRDQSAHTDKEEMVILQPDELQALFDAGANQKERVFVTTATLTWIREGELIGLLWGDIDWHNCQAHVREPSTMAGSMNLRARRQGARLTWPRSL